MDRLIDSVRAGIGGSFVFDRGRTARRVTFVHPENRLVCRWQLSLRSRAEGTNAAKRSNSPSVARSFGERAGCLRGWCMGSMMGRLTRGREAGFELVAGRLRFAAQFDKLARRLPPPLGFLLRQLLEPRQLRF